MVSLPRIHGRQSDLLGTYRFLRNRRVSPEEILQPHHAASSNRLTAAALPLVIHDTTEFKFEHMEPDEIGHLQTGAAGFFGHLSLAVDGASREVLGVTAFETLHRAQRSRRDRSKSSGGDTASWADRESLRWERGVESTERRLLGQVSPIHVMDRENDCYQRMAAMVESGRRFIIRARHNRAARDESTEQWTKLETLVERADVVLTRDVPLSRRKTKTAPVAAKDHPARKGRMATLHFASAEVEVRRPRYVSVGPEALRVSVVHAYEPDPPEGEEPVDWVLLTTEPASTKAELELVVDGYRARWLVEEFFKALKTGCAYEDRLLESKHALLVALALSIPIAASVLAARAQAQQEPTVPASRYFSGPQLAILRVLRPKHVPRNPTLQQALLAVASLGGHWRSNGMPGWQILSRGMRALVDYEIGWYAREDAEM